MLEAAGMHLIRTCTGNKAISCCNSQCKLFSSWITPVSYNAPGLVLHIGIGDRTKDNENS